MQTSQLKREDYCYHAAFCEENIWHLCQQPTFLNSYVVFIVSKGEAFPMLNQHASEHPSIPIFWDYHVVLLVKGNNNQIVDFDTHLEFGTEISTYLKESFLDERLLIDEEVPLFRLVPSNEYVELFSSDRSHMQSPTGWLAPPPPWPIIGNAENNLSDFIEASENGFGELLNYDEMLARFSCLGSDPS